MDAKCSECGVTFSRRDGMLRHFKGKHETRVLTASSPVPIVKARAAPRPQVSTQPSGTMPSAESSRSSDEFIFKHPFTLVCAGPTSSGKSYFVKDLLIHRNHVIVPSPQKIYFFYSEWQDLYRQMAENVPNITFVQGIPDDIDDDNYFDSSNPNFIVFDDLMSDAASDTRIADIFTKKSHHRNLSVCLILQNMYKQGKVMRDISLNSQYMVLFKNPRDKLQISMLARQMYPGKNYKLLNMYEKATERPHGYLLIDLKSDTPECSRLKTNVLPTEQTTVTKPEDVTMEDQRSLQNTTIQTEANGVQDIIGERVTEKGSVERGTSSSKDSIKGNTTDPCRDLVVNSVSGEVDTVKGDKDILFEFNTDEDMSAKMYHPCEDCGVVFAYEYDLERHKRKHCPENEDSDSETKPKKMRKEPQVIQQEAWNDLFRDTMSDVWSPILKKRRGKYLKQGYEKPEAMIKAREDYLDEVRKDFRERYIQFLRSSALLEKDSVHNKVMETIEQLREDYNMEPIEAIRQAVKLRKMLFDDIIPNPSGIKQMGAGRQDDGVDTNDAEDSKEEDSQEEEELDTDE